MTKEPKKESTEQPAQETKDPIEEMTNLLKRTQANFENYRKQNEKRVDDIRKMAAKNIILELLPILDNFELALKNTDTNSNPKDFIQGIELIYGQLNSLLENNDVKPILTENQEFDPHIHEALMKVDSSEPENQIIDTFQRGFTMHGSIIRHAKVKISSGKKPQEK